MKNTTLILFLLISTLRTVPVSAMPSLSQDKTAKDSLLKDHVLTETIQCEGLYPMHLQGISTDKNNSIYWSFTNEMVRTDLKGKVLNRIKVLSHHGDLCYEDGNIYIAVNLGKFNQLAGQADSWVFVYDARDLKELARHRMPELVHGAGGMAFNKGKFYVVGGLPVGFNENYVYEYDRNFKFIKRHVVASGYTQLGIQTAGYYAGQWWFGCYGNPKLLRTDDKFQMLGKSDFDASLGIVAYSKTKLMIGTSKANADKLHVGTVRIFEKR
jgi:hypothetical protein